jgi:hypothetical protein
MAAETHHPNHDRRIETLYRDPKLLWWKLLILRPVQIEILRGCIGCCLDMIYLLLGSTSRPNRLSVMTYFVKPPDEHPQVLI